MNITNTLVIFRYSLIPCNTFYEVVFSINFITYFSNVVYFIISCNFAPYINERGSRRRFRVNSKDSYSVKTGNNISPISSILAKAARAVVVRFPKTRP